MHEWTVKHAVVMKITSTTCFEKSTIILNRNITQHRNVGKNTELYIVASVAIILIFIKCL